MRLTITFILLSFLAFGQDHRVPKNENVSFRKGFAFSFNTARKVSDWVGYTVSSSDVQGEQNPTKLYYKDSAISTCPNPDDYEHYSYAQGALKPTSAARSSKAEMKAVNNYVNIVPMDLALKKGVWRILENLISGWAVTFDSVHVVTGPIYGNKVPEMIGDSRVNVPDKFFKVVMVYNGMDMASIGFIIPNKPDANELKKYSMSVDSVEFETGYDFFSDLPDYLEFFMEEKIEAKIWKDQSMSYQLKAEYPKEGRCVAAGKNDQRCTINTSCVSQNCWQHGCDVKEEK